MKIAIIGATGLVGQTMVRVLEEKNFSIKEFLPAASPRSRGKEVKFKGIGYRVMGLDEILSRRPDIVLMSAGSAVSLEWAPRFASFGITVIDNSSAWRMDKTKKLIIPEINGILLKKTDKIIANPNCSTIQMLMVLAPLHKKYKVERVIISTYQSVTGTGMRAVEQLMNERKGIDHFKVYPYQIDLNVIPQIGPFYENGFCEEEMKLVNETVKILRTDKIKINATTVRIPTIGGHGQSLNVKLHREYRIDEIRKHLAISPGLAVEDDITNMKYPMPVLAHGKDTVFVGRIRQDETQSKSINLFTCTDNLRKGSATNAIQIAEYMLKNKLM
ncbi:MAG: aspartate-semialdehyde dehydrogenase [Bacteroidetes bacterium]|nr:aspartate-semialdehyde dehydrogenase [Bacteroidota bacterium]